MEPLRQRSWHALALYFKFLGIAIRSRMEYRSDFLIGMASVVILNVINLSVIWVMVSGFHVLAGWQFWEIVMLYGMFLLSHSVYAVFFWHLSTLEEDILRGRLDQYLVRPCSTLLQFLGREVNYVGVADLVFASAAFSLAYGNLGLDWPADKWVLFAVAVVSGTVIETCLVWIIGTLAFWVGRSRTIFFIYMQFMGLGQRYPMDVFGKWYRIFVTGFLPLAFMNYYPLAQLLGKPNALGVAGLGFLSPVVACILLILGSLVWRKGLAGYTSSGS
jgi:ABC-2 type transport system permease protein